jgi:hypothetical protein
MRVSARALKRGPVHAVSSPVRTPVLGRQFCSRGNKVSTYRMRAASSLVPPKPLHFLSPCSVTLPRDLKPGEDVASARPADLCTEPPDEGGDSRSAVGQRSCPS